MNKYLVEYVDRDNLTQRTLQRAICPMNALKIVIKRLGAYIPDYSGELYAARTVVTYKYPNVYGLNIAMILDS